MLKRLLETLGTYQIYEYWLRRQIIDKKIPSHVGMILDGNRRWAKLKGRSLKEGHEFGARVAEDFLNWAMELGIKTVTLYVLSTENLSRPQEEVESILNLIREYLEKTRDRGTFHIRKVRVTFIGKLSLLPEGIQKLAQETANSTRQYDSFFLNLAIAYGGRQEIIDMAKNIARDAVNGRIAIDRINQELISEYLYTSHLPNPEPDIVIRTSGEERLSGFLLWQSAYSELVFLDIYWPDFRKIDLMRAIRIYQNRTRRFGL